MNLTDRASSTAPADPTPPGGPGLAPGGAGLPAVVMTAHSRASHSKSFGSLIRPYGRGKGLSIAALRYEIPSPTPVVVSSQHAAARGHYGSHLGGNRGSFRAPVAPSDAVGGGRRG